MNLNTKGRYAVMAVTDLVLNSQGKPMPLLGIASRQNVSLPYLEQIFAKLKRAGLVTSARGPGGGYLLARDADTITIAHILDAVGESVKSTRCAQPQLGGCVTKGVYCLSHHLWQELGDHIYGFLDSISLADVATGNLKRGTRA